MRRNPYYRTCVSFLTLAASAAFVIAGCSKTETAPEGGRTELRLTNRIEMTRAGSPNTQATQIVSGEKVTVWVEDNGAAAASASLYALEMTAQEDGALTGGTEMYYPQTGNGVQISALHGDFVFPADGIPESIPSSIDFSVAADQSASGGEGYIKSDLLYASQSAKRSSAAVQLQFYHLLSKLELNISKSAEVTDEIASVTFDDIALEGRFEPGAVTDITDRSSRAAGISASTTTKVLTLGTALDNSNEAIIVPQDISGKTLTFTLAGGGKLVYTFPTGTVFESGKKYVYDVKLKLTGLGVSTSIVDWDASAGEIDGEATMQVPVLGKKNASQARKGDFAMVDGSFVDKNDTLTEEQIAGCTGIVFWTEAEKTLISPTLADDQIMAEDFPDCTHGLIVSLKNISSSMIWQEREGYGDCKSIYKDFQESSPTYGSVSKYKAVAPDFDIESQTGYDYTADPFNQILGYQNTKVTRAYNAYAAEQGWNTVNIVQPVAALESFESANPSPEGSTGWYIPSIKELTLLAYGDFDGGKVGSSYSNCGLYTTKSLTTAYYLLNWAIGEVENSFYVNQTVSHINRSLNKVGGEVFSAPASESAPSIYYRASTEGHSWSKNASAAEQMSYYNNTYSLYFYPYKYNYSESDGTQSSINYVCVTIYPYGKRQTTNVRAVCAF